VVNLPILRTWFAAADEATLDEVVGAEPRRGLGGAIALVVVVAV